MILCLYFNFYEHIVYWLQFLTEGIKTTLDHGFMEEIHTFIFKKNFIEWETIHDAAVQSNQFCNPL